MVLKLVLCVALWLYAAEAASIAGGVRLYGVNYSLRQGSDWDPDDVRCKSLAQAEQELQQLKADITDNIRIFSTTDCDTPGLLKLTKQLGLGLWMGIWAQKDPAIFDNERVKLLELLNNTEYDFSHVIGMHVTSEAIYREEITVEQAIEYRNIIKADLDDAGLDSIPVTVADIVDTYIESPDLIAADSMAVTMNHFGFFSPKTDLNNAAAYLETQYTKVEEQAEGRQIIVTETGWPDAGKITSSNSLASSVGMAKYLRDFVCLANKRDWQYFWFTSYDSDWRRVQEKMPDSVEGNFGLLTQDGMLKKYLADLTINCTQESTDIDLTTISQDTSAGTPSASSCLTYYVLAVCVAGTVFFF